jgi:hypothetical protein
LLIAGRICRQSRARKGTRRCSLFHTLFKDSTFAFIFFVACLAWLRREAMATMSPKRTAGDQFGPKTKRQSRNKGLCDECRTIKKKCTPEEGRNWEAGEKCNNCIKRKKACGPNKEFEKPSGPQEPAAMTRLTADVDSSTSLLPSTGRSILPKPPTSHANENVIEERAWGSSGDGSFRQTPAPSFGSTMESSSRGQLELAALSVEQLLRKG